MGDDYTPTTDEVRERYANQRAFIGGRKHATGRVEFDRWHANDNADAVMGFATHYLPHALWVKAKQYADDIREGR